MRASARQRHLKMAIPGSKPYRHPLFQVFVLQDERLGNGKKVTRPLALGPKAGRDMVEVVHAEISKAIRSGDVRVRGWHDPIILPADQPEPAFPRFGNDTGNLRKLVEVAQGGSVEEYRKMREQGTSVNLWGDLD
jgi:hypothetical protein